MSTTATAVAAPVLSVVIPVRNSPAEIRECLSRLADSDYPDFEIIVIDDASTDDTPSAIRAANVQLIELTTNVGPAEARNRGAAEARGEHLVFLDADVLVRPDTLSRIAAALSGEADVDAIFGSYDEQPRAVNFISQYRNLLHHFTHQVGAREAGTFWAGCGAVRRAVFMEQGGFAGAYGRPSIEDIEFGVRLRRSGRRIVLEREIQVTHLKRWTFWGMLRTDYRDRALPWTELILRERSMPNDLNLGIKQRLAALLAFAWVGSFAVGAVLAHALVLLVPFLLLASVVLLDRFTLQRKAPMVTRLAGLGLLLACGAATAYFLQWWALVPLAIGLCIVLLNARFYWFLATRRNVPFAILAFPLHVFYYLYSSLAFAQGILRHRWRRWRGNR